MNELGTAFKQQKEIQDMINVITTTAKLIGYTVKTNDDYFNYHTTDFRFNSVKSVATILHYITVDNDVRLQVQHKDLTENFIKEPQEDKIRLLNDLMQKL